MKIKKSIHIAFLLLAGMAIGALAVTQLNWLPPSRATVSESAVSSTSPAAVSSPSPNVDTDLIYRLNNTFATIAEDVKPSVVTIFADKTVKVRANPHGLFGDKLFDRFFGYDAPERQRRMHGMGSGVIISGDGYILTNNHVIRDADKIEVMFLGGKRVKAEIVGTDPKTDIAVVKVARDGLKPIKLGDSDALRVGEWVLAVGSPLSADLAHTITSGIVSAKGRSNMNLARYEDFIQTDAAINPGNSGGALVNLHGELVGINTAIASENGGFQGIGFAVPVNMARDIMNALIENGRVVRGWLGIGIQDVTEPLAEAFDLPAGKGVIVSQVEQGSPAAKAGLQAQDVILELDGEEINGANQLSTEIAKRAPGTNVTLIVLRDGKRKKIKVELGELESEKQAAVSGKSDTQSLLGFSVETMDRQLAAGFKIDADGDGVVVTDIRQGSAAFEAGLRRGDLILSVNKQKIASAREFYRISKSFEKGDSILLYIFRGSQRFFLAFEL